MRCQGENCRIQLLQKLQLRRCPWSGSIQSHISLCWANQEPSVSRTNGIVWVLYKSQKDDSGCPYSPSLATQSQG